MDAGLEKHGRPPHTHMVDGGKVICPASDGNGESGTVYNVYTSGGYVQGLNEDVLVAAANHVLYGGPDCNMVGIPSVPPLRRVLP